MERDNSPDAATRGGVQVVERAARILRALEGNPEGLSLSQIAERVGLARSTVHRLVTALEAERFVVSASPNGRVRLGPGLARLAGAARRDLRDEIHPFLERLSREVHETVDLAVLEHDHVRFIDQVAAPRRLRAVSSVGAFFPAHCTANGKALLALLTEDDLLHRLPAKLERHTPHTITDRAELIAELERVRGDGVAYDREEHTIGICAVGVAVREPAGALVAVTIPLPSQRFYGNEATLAAALRSTCEEIEQALRSS